MTDDGEWSRTTRTVASVERSDRVSDVTTARRGAASFGSGAGPTLGSTVREFVRKYGWRAYALPVLVVVTIVALVTAKGDPAKRKDVAQNNNVAATSTPKSSTPPVAPNNLPLKSDNGGVANSALAVGELPRGAAFTMRGDGTFRVLPGTTKVVGSTGKLFHYDITVEKGVTGVDLDAFATSVDKTLADPRSWSGHGVRLQRVSKGPVDFSISLTSALTVRKYCGYDIPVETSCYATQGTGGATENRVVVNVARWVRGAAPYIGDLDQYHVYMINHETGHALGHMHAHTCLPGGLAPVMMQQTFGLRSATTHANCGANPWPYPPGAQGVPGVEAPDTKANNEYYMGDGD